MTAPSLSITELVAHAAKLGATFRLAGDAVSVTCTETLPPPLYAALKERRDELWHLLGGDTSDQQPLDLLSRLDVAPVIPDTWERACAALAEIEADSDRYTPAELSGRPGLLGLDIETAALPGAEQRPLLKLRKDGLPAKHQPKLRGGAGLDPHRSRIRLVQLYGGGDRCLVLDTDLVSIDVLRPVLQRRTMVIHNAGFELRYFAAAGLSVPHFEDTMQAAGLLLGVNQRSLDDATFAYLGIELPKELQTSDWSAAQLSDGQLAYAALDAIVALRLWLRLRAELLSKGRGGAYLLQRDVTQAVTRMVSRGILLDRAAHKALLVQWSSQLADAREAFLTATGQPVPGTPDAIRAYLERVLPEPLRAQWPRTVKTGELTLREAELRRVAHLPAVQALLRVQATEKLLNSFGDELANKVSAKTGRIHPSFSIAGTKTGRFASSRPNVQQLPKRRAADFRDCIRAADGHSLVVGDFHMMELRAAAAISGDPQMTADFANGIDLHRQQAAAMLGIPYEQVDAEARDKAKPVNFSMIYGAGAAGLVATAWNNYGITLSLSEAEHARRSFLTRYATYAEWMSRNHAQCTSTGVIRIGQLGRVIEASWEKRKQPASGNGAHWSDSDSDVADDYYADLAADAFHSAAHGWAQDLLKYTLCCNAPIQGACADASMLALTAVDAALQKAGIDGGPVLFVHDEIVLEVADQQAEQAKHVLAACMRQAFATTFPSAPLNKVVSIGVGKTWGTAKSGDSPPPELQIESQPTPEAVEADDGLCGRPVEGSSHPRQVLVRPPPAAETAATECAALSPAVQTIVNADCLEHMRGMAARSVDCIVTSPPYNLGKRYSLHNDNMPEAAYLTMMGDVAKELGRVVKPDGHVFLNVGWNSKHPWRSIDVLSTYRPYFSLQNTIAWVKSLAIDGTALPEKDMISLPALAAWLESVGLPIRGKAGTAVRQGLCAALRTDMHERTIGQFTSLTSDYYLNSGWENIWHLTPTGRSPIDRQATGVKYVWGNQPDRFEHYRKVHCRGDAWQLPYATIQSKDERFHHPAPYPVELVLTCLKLAKLGTDALVLDPFAGIGSTLLAARTIGLDAVGIEIDPAYCAAARQLLDADISERTAKA